MLYGKRRLYVKENEIEKPQYFQKHEKPLSLYQISESVISDGNYFWRKEQKGWIVYDKEKKHYYYYPFEDRSNDKLTNLLNDGIDYEQLEKINFALSAPLRVYYDITYNCNFSCSYCYNKTYTRDESQYLNWEEKQGLLKQMAAKGIYRISIAGGEPFLDKDLHRFIELANQYSIDVSMSSNGSCISEEDIVFLKKGLIKRLSISLDSITPRGNASRKGMYVDKVLDNIKRIKQETSLDIAVKFVLDLDKDIEDLFKVVAFCKQNVIRTVKICFMRRGAELNNYDEITFAEKYYRMLKKLEEIKLDYFINIVAPCSVLYNNNLGIVYRRLGWGCSAGKDLMFVNPYGSIKPCIMFGDESIIGNIKKDDIHTIWSERCTKLFQEPEACKSCDLTPICNGGCRYRAFEKYGDNSSKDPFCYQQVRKLYLENENLLNVNLDRTKKSIKYYLSHY